MAVIRWGWSPSQWLALSLQDKAFVMAALECEAEQAKALQRQAKAKR